MPYIDRKRSKYANYWFSASFAPNQWVFNHIVTKKSLRQLEKQKGVSIIFTHLGYFMRDGKIDPGFVERINWLTENPNGKYIPVSDVLTSIAESRKTNGSPPYPVIPPYYKVIMELRHLITRVKYRKFIKLDDYAFKNLKKEMFIKHT